MSTPGTVTIMLSSGGAYRRAQQAFSHLELVIDRKVRPMDWSREVPPSMELSAALNRFRGEAGLAGWDWRNERTW